MSNYPLRLPDHVMAEAKHLAELNGTSLNQFLSSLIAERVGNCGPPPTSSYEPNAPIRRQPCRSSLGCLFVPHSLVMNCQGPIEAASI